MWQLTRYVYVHLHLDANRINSRQAIENMNTLETWAENGVIHIELSEVAQNEVLKSSDPRRRRKAFGYLATETLATTAGERRRLKRIEQTIFPDGASCESDRRDVEIVFNADKYGAILVTNDGGSKRQQRGILGSAEALAEMSITVMSDGEAVAYVRRKITERDALARELAAYEGTPVPEWVGMD